MFSSDETTPTGDQLKPTGGELEYTFGRPPSTYLSLIEIMRLTIVRSKLLEAYGDLTPTQDRAA